MAAGWCILKCKQQCLSALNTVPYHYIVSLSTIQFVSYLVITSTLYLLLSYLVKFYSTLLLSYLPSTSSRRVTHVKHSVPWLCQYQRYIFVWILNSITTTKVIWHYSSFDLSCPSMHYFWHDRHWAGTHPSRTTNILAQGGFFLWQKSNFPTVFEPTEEKGQVKTLTTLTSLKIIMDNSKNERWIIPFKKFRRF